MLEHVEVRQLVQGIPLAITVLAGSPLSWSEEQQLAVVTQLGTYIFELNLTPEDGTPGIVFNRCFIPPPEEPNPYLHTGIILKQIVEELEPSVSHRIMLDGVLSAKDRAGVEADPRVSRSTSAMPGGDLSHKGYSKGVWSPYGVGLHERCVMTLVTYDHRVMIVSREKNKWTQLFDISAVWYEKVSSNSWGLVSHPENAEPHEIHTARVYMLSILDILWTSIIQDNYTKYAVLIMITGSGHAVLWKIPLEFTSASEVQLISIEDTKMTLVSASYWLNIDQNSGYLVLGSGNGQVKMFYISFSEEFVWRDLGFVYSSVDRIRVNHLKLLHLQDRVHLLFLAKQSFFLAITIDVSEEYLSPHFTAHRQIGRFPISGMHCLENYNVYLSSKDGNIQHVYIRFEEDCIEIDHLGTPFSSEGVSYIGFVTSPHSTLWAILESVSVSYDHLIVREPSQISIYQIGCGATIFDHLQKSEAPLHLNMDLLESLRLHTYKSGEPSLKLIAPKEIPHYDASKHKLYFWLAKMFRSIHGHHQNDAQSLEEIEDALRNYMLEKSIVDTIQRFSVESPNDLSPVLKYSLSLMCKWVTDNGVKEYEHFASSLSKKFDTHEAEQCPICSSEVEFDLLSSGTCNNGHTLPRCCRTFLLTKPVIICSRCKVFCHDEANVLQKTKIATCLFCDGRMTLLTRRF